MKKRMTFLVFLAAFAVGSASAGPLVQVGDLRPLTPPLVGPVVIVPLGPCAVTAEDQDGDCILNGDDNCPLVSNEDQKDNNFNGIGDACDGDYDGDGVPDDSDNCWDVKNPDQYDLDGDDVGDACDIDRDGDGLTNDFELTIGTDPDNFDTDGDNVTDYYDCDKLNPEKGLEEDCGVKVDRNPPPQPNPSINDPNADDDGDGIPNGSDNCPLVFNPGQQDLDGDGVGDLCDNETNKVLVVPVAQGGGGFVGGCSLIL
jgi:hypothetical protein